MLFVHVARPLAARRRGPRMRRVLGEASGGEASARPQNKEKARLRGLFCYFFVICRIFLSKKYTF